MISDVPASRLELLPALADYAAGLTSSLDRLRPTHRAAAGRLADWIARHHRPGMPLGVVCICTGNSRRSILASTLGNVAAAYHGLPGVRFHSGGTAPTAFNPRTIETLRAIGVAIEPTGAEAPRGEPETPNPIQTLRWGRPEAAGAWPLEAVEFSKRYDDPANPRQDFAAILLCSEADAGCPIVEGASIRIPAPFDDPKAHDDTPGEAAAYAERRDDIARMMLAALGEAQLRIDPAG